MGEGHRTKGRSPDLEQGSDLVLLAPPQEGPGPRWAHPILIKAAFRFPQQGKESLTESFKSASKLAKEQLPNLLHFCSGEIEAQSEKVTCPGLVSQQTEAVQESRGSPEVSLSRKHLLKMSPLP